MKKCMIKLSLPTIILISSTYLYGNTLQEVVEHTMTNNPKVLSTLKNNDAYKLYIDEAEGGYYPKLDLTAYVGTKRTKTSPDIGNKTESDTQGYNAQLDFEQLIYDGGLTSGQIDEAQYRYNSNKYLNESIVDDIIYDSVDSYLNLVKYKNRLDVAKKSLAIYEDYLITAKETEEISGESLQKAQVNAKIHFAKNSMYADTNNNLRAVSSFTKNVGIAPDGKSCRPNINNSRVPTSLKTLIDDVLVTNPLILEQVENIKEQRAILNQKDASFYPTIKFKAQGIFDKDLVTEDERTQVYTARIELAYNLFNGNKDKSSSMREKIFLQEAQKNLDTVTTEVVDETTASYNTFVYSKKRVTELEAYIKDNENILSIYKDQFEGGTRTFIDVLNIERDLTSAKQDLIDAEYDLDSAYFQVFTKLGGIEEAVVNANVEACTETKPKMEERVQVVETTSDDVQAMLADESTSLPPAANIEGTYGLYIVAYRNITRAEESLGKAKNILGEDINIKLEPARGYNSVVIYNISTMDEVKTIQSKIDGNFPGSYIRKFTK
ncbi:TolC family protein [Arcobacter sp. LA11]|uniref:TolC family protein n=1 Tax=Arcobacter sp. LA11 TaxID=1898176 RepID=UPI000932B0A5|nr:TolC family protein [Arcobacter sp. LA11]